jgi:anti-anti-sigma factor
LDSFGIGILLLVSDQVNARGSRVVLRHLHGQVGKIAEQAKLSRVFAIEDLL